MMTKLTAISLVVVAAAFPDTAMAASCGSGISGQSPAVKMLQRQLSALRSIQRGRGCKPGDTGGGLFNACREVGMKINEVQQELRATAAANNECKAEARTAKAPTKPKAMKVSAAGNARPQPATEAPKKVRGPKNAGAGKVGQRMAQDIEQSAPKGPLVKLNAGKTVGVLFLQSVELPQSASIDTGGFE